MSEKSTVLAPLFSILEHLRISEETRQQIASNIEVRRVNTNTILLLSGSICKHVYFVVSGGFVCRYFNENLEIPKTIIFYLDDLQPFMACVDSHFSQQPSAFELRAVRDSVVLSMSKKHLDAMMQSNPADHFFPWAIKVPRLGFLAFHRLKKRSSKVNSLSVSVFKNASNASFSASVSGMPNCPPCFNRGSSVGESSTPLL